eukprot:jgi/Mesvir1/17991/Mv26531-RA.1
MPPKRSLDKHFELSSAFPSTAARATSTPADANLFALIEALPPGLPPSTQCSTPNSSPIPKKTRTSHTKWDVRRFGAGQRDFCILEIFTLTKEQCDDVIKFLARHDELFLPTPGDKVTKPAWEWLLQEPEAYLKAVIMCSYLRCDAHDITQIGYAGLRSLLHERRRAATAAAASPQSSTSPSTDSIRAAVAEQLAPMAEQLAALNAPDGPLNTLSAKVNNIEARVALKLQPQFTATQEHIATKVSEATATVTTRLNQVEGRVGQGTVKLEAVAAKVDALATQVPEIAERTATIAAQPAGRASDDPSTRASWADLLKSQASSTTTAITTKLQELEDTRREAADRDRRRCRVILRRFDMLPEETPDSLLDELKKQLLARMQLPGAILQGAYRLPHPRAKAGPPPVVLTFSDITARVRFLSRRKKLVDTSWSLDDDLTPAQQQQRRDQWPDYIRHKTNPEKPQVYWRGGDLYVNKKLWKPPRASPG